MNYELEEICPMSANTRGLTAEMMSDEFFTPWAFPLLLFIVRRGLCIWSSYQSQSTFKIDLIIDVFIVRQRITNCVLNFLNKWNFVHLFFSFLQKSNQVLVFCRSIFVYLQRFEMIIFLNMYHNCCFFIFPLKDPWTKQLAKNDQTSSESWL